MDLEGNRFVKFEFRAAVERDKGMGLESEGYGHDAAGGVSVGGSAAGSVVCGGCDSGGGVRVGRGRVGEDGDVVIGRFFGLTVEPEAGCDLVKRHDEI